MADVQHQTTGRASTIRRRTASRRAKPRASAPQEAALAAPLATGFTSCTPQGSRPEGSTSSAWAQPSVHRRLRSKTSVGPNTAGWRSIARTCARRCSRSSFRRTFPERVDGPSGRISSRTSAATGAVRGRARLRSAEPAPDNAKPERGQVSGADTVIASSWGNGGASVTAVSHLEFVFCSYYGPARSSIKNRTKQDFPQDAAQAAGNPASRRSSVSHVDRSSRPSTRDGLKWRWNARRTETVSASRAPLSDTP